MSIAEYQSQLLDNTLLSQSTGGLFDTVDARTSLAGSNKMEILLFSLGTQKLLALMYSRSKRCAVRWRLPRRLTCRRV